MKKTILFIFTLFVLFLIPVSGEAKTLYVDPNGNDSVTYANNSVTSPWRSIGRAAWGSTNRSAPNSGEAARAGDVVTVNAGTYTTSGAYTDIGNPGGAARWDVAYYTINSGTLGNPIVIQANGTVNLNYSNGVGPIIGATTYAGGNHQRNYITWRGFTIDESLAPSAPDTGPAVCAGVTGCVFENNTIIGVLNKQRDDNYNGIRLEDAMDVVIRNNRIMNFQGTFGRNHAGIMTYRSGNVLIENNEFSGVRTGDNRNSGVGIYLKANNPNRGWVTIRYNKFANFELQGLHILLEPATASNPTKVYQNIFTGSQDGVFINAFDYGSADPRNIKVFNNTFVNNTISALATNRDMVLNAGHIFKNNVVSGGQAGINIYSAQIDKGRLDSEHNVVYGVTTFGYFGTTPHNLSSWQALGQDIGTPTTITSNPLFVSSTDFHLQPSSPARTIGVDIFDLDSDGSTSDIIPAGAYITGNEVIGLASGTTVTPPVNPTPTADIKVNNSDATVSVTAGTSVTVSWVSTNSATCSVSPSGFTGTSGTQTVTPTVNTTYSISCSGSGGTARDSVAVNISSSVITPPATTTPSTGFTFCANENGSCSFAGTREVRYGANNSFAFRTLAGGTLCTNDVFGDPLPNTFKQCYLRDLASTTSPAVTPPYSPSSLTANTISDSQINLSWTDNSINETGFRIERMSGSGIFSEIITVGANTTTFQDIGLLSGTVYSYRVRSYNTVVSSSYSNEVNSATQTPPIIVTPPATTTPPVITDMKVGDSIKTTSRIRVRETPGGKRLGSQRRGSLGVITEGPTLHSGYSWYRVNYDSGVDGWTAGLFLTEVSTVASTQDEIRNQIASMYLLIKQLQEQLANLR